MTVTAAPANPFPGLRPFGPDEDHLFFGREREVDELLRRLRTHQFVAVVGTSGCGKSSLIRCGVIPALQGGSMTRAGPSWRIAILRPGEDPIGHLAEALDAPDVIGSTDDELASTNRVLVEAALRRGTRGLVDAVRLARIPPGDNLLVVVDQFEELFRFQRSRQHPSARDETVAFVKLLLEAVAQTEVPIYVVITMRSDFIGDCMEYPGLPEVLNASQYLVPRMARDELRAAIEGPVAVAGARIAPRLVLRLLNDLGNDQDRLPVLQHALMRTWEHWAARHEPGAAIDIVDYEAVGTLRDALSRHAEEAFAETGAGRGQQITERMFKALTDTVADPRGTRRPCSVAELAALAEASEAEIVEIADIFRRQGRSFLMPPPEIRLEPSAIVDLSHESLMRCWRRLIQWADEERSSAGVYLRLTRAAVWFEEGTAGLWRDPELELGLRWRRENRPTAVWARRYNDLFDRAMAFLDQSERERNRLAAERAAERRRQWRQLQWTAALLAVLLLAVGVFASVAFRAADRARAENVRAEENLRLARAAVERSLSVAERDPTRLAVDVPQIVAFRQQLLEEAQRFYQEFTRQAPDNEELRRDMAFAYVRLAHIDRALGNLGPAAGRYRQAIVEFERLADETPARAEYRQALAGAYNWLGETLRMSANRYSDAEAAYGEALRLQQELSEQQPANEQYRADLARTFYNRGILYSESAGSEPDSFDRAESDFRNAIRLLEPMAGGGAPDHVLQDLGRAYNNLAALLAGDPDNTSEARDLYLRALGIHEGLAPRDREYALELVVFSNNFASLLSDSGDIELARKMNQQALDVIEELARPAPSLSIQRADTNTVRGRILEADMVQAALDAYGQALRIYMSAGSQGGPLLPAFHLRFGDLVENLAFLQRERPDAGAAPLLSEAVAFYVDLARKNAGAGAPDETRAIADTLRRVAPALPDPQRGIVNAAIEDVQSRPQRPDTDGSPGR